MSDWDTVTKIGSKSHGGSGPRQTTVRGKSALNAAARSGSIVATEKKYTTGNAKSNPEGQRLTKVADADDVVKINKVSRSVSVVVEQARNEKGWSQDELAQKCRVLVGVIRLIERPPPAAKEGAVADQAVLTRLQNALGVKLTGKDIGAPLGQRTYKRNEGKK